MGPTADLNTVEERKISCFCREFNPGRSSHSPSLYRLSYPGSAPLGNVKTDIEETGHVSLVE
jgi:hypothetical protein